MDEYSLPTFLHSIDERTTALFHECTKQYEEILVHYEDYFTRQSTEMPQDIADVLNRHVNQNVSYNVYYSAAVSFLENAKILVVDNTQSLAWFVECIDELIDNKEKRHQPYALCCYHQAVKCIHQFMHLCVKTDEATIKRSLVEVANRHLHTTAETFIKGIVNVALTIPVIPQAAIALGDAVSRSVQEIPPRYNGTYLPYLMRLGISFADLAYGNVVADIDNEQVRTLNPISVHVEGKELCGRIDLENGLSGFIGQRANGGQIIIGFRGTSTLRNWWTNLIQFCFCDDIVYRMALGLVIITSEQYSSKRVLVFGHSLGGGLTQFAVTASGKDNVIGYGYNSAGLSKMTLSRMSLPKEIRNVYHYHLRNDIVFNIGNHLGEQIHSTANFHTGINLELIKRVHSIDMLRIALKCDRYWTI